MDAVCNRGNDLSDRCHYVYHTHKGVRNMIWTLASIIAVPIVAHIIYSIGYVRGHKAGLDYAKGRMDEYHQHVMAGLRELR